MSDLKAKPGPFLLSDRPLPHSLEAERAVLSCLLQDPAYCMDLVFSKLQTDACMYGPAHRKLYNCINDLRANNVDSSTIDVITIIDQLERTKVLEEIGGEEFIQKIYNVVPTTANVENYINYVLDSYTLRRMIHSCSDIVSKCYESDDNIPQLVDHIEQEILKITEMQTVINTHTVKELLPDVLETIEKMSKGDVGVQGFPTGFVDLDKLITGLRAQEMIVLAARPSIGKTTLAMNIVRNVAVLSQVPVAFFSLEMGAEQVVQRVLCGEAKLDMRDVRDGNLSSGQWQDLMKACGRLSNTKILIDDTPQITSLELRQKARRMKQEHDIQFIAIDYLQLMQPPGNSRASSREQEVAKMSSDIKALAKELNVPIMILAQLNRAAEASGQPKLSNLRESGAIEQDADVVALLHRERETDNEETAQRVREGLGIESKLIIAKNRNGATGIVDLVFHPQWTMFDSCTRIKDEDVPI